MKQEEGSALCAAAIIGAEIASLHNAHEKADEEFFATRGGVSEEEADRLSAAHEFETKVLDIRLGVLERQVVFTRAQSVSGALCQLAAVHDLLGDVASFVDEDGPRAQDARQREQHANAAIYSIRALLVSLGADPALVEHSLSAKFDPHASLERSMERGSGAKNAAPSNSNVPLDGATAAA